MSSNVQVVPFTVKNNDCVLDVVQHSPPKKCTPKLRLPTGDEICKFIIFLFISGIASVVAIFLGEPAFVLFHGKDAEINFGLCMLYGYLTLIIIFLILILIICICCPNMGKPKMKRLK